MKIKSITKVLKSPITIGAIVGGLWGFLSVFILSATAGHVTLSRTVGFPQFVSMIIHCKTIMDTLGDKLVEKVICLSIFPFSELIIPILIGTVIGALIGLIIKKLK